MRKTIGILILLLCAAITGNAQNQKINGTLTVTSTTSIGEDISEKWGEGIRLYLRGTATSNDPIWIAKYSEKQEYTDLRINVGDAKVSEDRFVVGTTPWDGSGWQDVFVVRMDGNVGIGVSQPTSKLDVNGIIRAKEVKIEATGWADYVFAKDYKLPSLTEVKAHIEENKHLPNIPSEAEVKANGVDLGDMQIKLLQKIEELTLYVIKQDERAREQQKEIGILKAKLTEKK